tara:strand:- start:9462 stop:9929 length:468 start_codon:yes stop_codon:yes gene_type:complete
MNIFAVIQNSTGKVYIDYSMNNSPSNFGNGKYIKKAIKKFGLNDFNKKTLEEFDNDFSVATLLERVEYWIVKFKSDEPEYGFNSTISELIPRKKKLTKKIQVLLTPEDETNLNQIIIEKCMGDGIRPLSISKYVRLLILEHIVNTNSLENKLKSK